MSNKSKTDPEMSTLHAVGILRMHNGNPMQHSSLNSLLNKRKVDVVLIWGDFSVWVGGGGQFSSNL